MIRVQGEQKSKTLEVRTLPKGFGYGADDFPRGAPYNVGQRYSLFAEAIRTGKSRLASFDEAVNLHRFIDTIQLASDTVREQPVA